MENKNVNFLNYLQVCGVEHIEDRYKEVVGGTDLDFKRYYNFMKHTTDELEDIIDSFDDITCNISDSDTYNKLIDISSNMHKIHKKYISNRGITEAARMLSCIGDELGLGCRDVVAMWNKLSKLYYTPPRLKLDDKYYKVGVKTITDGDFDINVMTCRCPKYKDINIGMVIYKDEKEEVYQVNNMKDIIKAASALRKKKFDYELAAVMPEYENIQLELEGYLLDKLSKKELSEIYDL